MTRRERHGAAAGRAAAAPGDGEHQQVERRGLGAEQHPAAVLEDPQADGRRHGHGEDRRHAPVAHPLGAPQRRHQVGDVGAGGHEQPRPEDAVDDDQREHRHVRRQHRVDGRKDRQCQARGHQHPALADAVGDPAGDRPAHRRGVGEEAQEQAGGQGAATERANPERRGRQELEGREEDDEVEPAHHDEARGEQAGRRGHRETHSIRGAVVPHGSPEAGRGPASYRPSWINAVTSISIRIRGSDRPAAIIVAAGRASPKYFRSTGQHCGNSAAVGRM